MTRRAIVAAIIVNCFVPCVSHAGDAPPLRVFYTGHSFHMFVPNRVGVMAKAAGLKEYKLAGAQGIGGSRVIQHWDKDKGDNAARKALEKGDVDVFTMAPHLLIPDPGVDNFVELGLKHNPRMRFLVQQSWMPFDFLDKKVKDNADRDTIKLDVKRLRTDHDLWRGQIEKQVKALNKKASRDAVFIVPAGDAVVRLREMVAEGKTPGITKQSQLFVDALGHGSAPLQWVVSYCNYACITGRSPVGLEVKDNAVSAELNRVLQEIAWDTVTRYSMSGVVNGFHQPGDDKVKAVKLFEVPNYTEGIVFDHAGNGYVSHAKVITKFTPDLKISTWAETGAPNGHKVLADGTHLVCDGSQHAVLHLSADGKVIGKASKECDGKPLRAPNDLTLDSHGGFWFTDPGGSDDKKLIGTVHYVDAKGKTHLVLDGLAFPNGIVLTPDGKTIYLAESKKNRVLSYPVIAPGKLDDMKVFCNLPEKKGEQIDNQPDGMCLDADGNLYVAHYGMKQVQVLDKTGKVIHRYPGGNLTTSNVGFAGPGMSHLYVTGALGDEQSRGAVFRLELPGVRGLKIVPDKK